MNVTSVHIKVEPKIKEQAQETAAQLGLSLSAVMKALLKQFIRTRKLSVDLEEKPSKYLLDSIRKSKEQLKKGEASPTFNNAEDAIKWLHESKI